MVQVTTTAAASPQNEIRQLDLSDREAALDMFRLVFGQTKTLEHWHWEFEARPLGRHIMLGFHQGNLAAQCAGLPLLLRHGNGRAKVLQGVDFMSHPKYRASRIFLKTVKSFFNTFGGVSAPQVPMIFGFPGTRHRLLGEKVLEYQTLAAVHCLQAPLPDKVKSAPLGDRVRGRLEAVKRWDDRADGLWTRCETAYPMAVIRDSQYLNWRYAEHPVRSYEILQVANRLGGRIECWAVLDLSMERGILVDFFPSLSARWANRFLLTEIGNLFCREGKTVMETWCHPRSPACAVLLEAGWSAVPQRDELHLGAVSFSTDMDLNWVKDHFYYTLGDTDVA